MSLNITFSKPRMVLDIPAYFPNVIKLRNGDLLVQLMWGDDRVPNQDEYDLFYAFDKPTTAEDWKKFNDERHEKDGNHHVHVLTGHWARSTDGGKTFTETCMPPAIEYVQLENGDVVALQWYTYRDKDGNPIVRSWTSHDNCYSWDAPYDIPLIVPPFGGLVTHRRIIALGGESFLVLVYGKLKGDTHDRSMVFRTTDNFKTMHYYSTCGMWRPGIEHPSGLNETDMVRTPDGRLLVVMRNESYHPMYQAHSSDNGATWTPVVRFPDTGVDPALCCLENGTVVCAYGRPGVKLNFSENNGEDWEKRSVVLWSKWEQDGESVVAGNGHGPSRSCSYTDVVETAPNVATLFYSAPVDWADDPEYTPWDAEQRERFRIYAIDATVERT